MTDEYFTRAQFEEAAAAIRAKTRHTPRIGIILGSGLGPLADAVQDADILLPSENIPYWPRSTVEGHIGRLVIGKLEGQMVLVQQGRAHSYEGHSMQRVTLPVRVMQRLGLETLIVTNAAGAINPAIRPGDVMLITDHINLMGMAGVSPLRGPNDDSLGVRFPDMSRAYDRELRALALEAAEEAGLRLHQGVYICLGGPSFETAEACSQYLITRHSICTVPWDDAGAHLRFSVTYEAADEAAEDRLMAVTLERLQGIKLAF
jgi:purine-nucleoside phosphorylase